MCNPNLQGDMTVQCLSTGFLATLNFKPGPDALVEGFLEQQIKHGAPMGRHGRIRSASTLQSMQVAVPGCSKMG